MTAICGGGPSQSKPGFNQTVVVSAAAVEGILVLSGLEEIAAAISPLIAGSVYELTTFCNTDPPADPGLTAQDLIDVLNFTDPTVSIPAIAKFRQWFESRYWYQVCQCTSATTPLPPALSNPGPLSTNPGLPTGSNAPCFSGTTTDTITAQTSGSQLHDLTPALLPTNGPSITGHNAVIGSSAGLSVTCWPIPTGVNGIQFSSQAIALDPAEVGFNGWTSAINWFDSSGNRSGSITVYEPHGQGASVDTGTFHPGDSVWPVGAAYYAVSSQRFGQSANTVSETVTVSTTVSCSGPALQQACCPPDPTIETRLNQIIGLLQSLWNSTSSPITSYAESSQHPVSGNGSFLLGAGSLAVKVQLTSVPSSIGQSDGDPVVYFDVGYLTPIAAEAPLAGWRIIYSPQLFQLPSVSEQIGYTLAPGVAATITELVKGP